MLYRAMRCKLGRMISLSRRRTFTKILVKVDIPVPIDQREVAFCYFTQMVPIDRKKKNKRRFRLKRQTSNTFLAWFGMSANNSSPTVVSVCDSMTGVCSASANYTAPNRLLPVCKENVSKINEQMKILETTGDLELCPCLRTSDFRKMTKIMCHEYFVDDFDAEMTEPTSKAPIKQDDSMDLLVAMFKGLTLDDKREIKESEEEHFETFHAHRPYGHTVARPYAKRMKVSRYNF